MLFEAKALDDIARNLRRVLKRVVDVATLLRIQGHVGALQRGNETLPTEESIANCQVTSP